MANLTMAYDFKEKTKGQAGRRHVFREDYAQ